MTQIEGSTVIHKTAILLADNWNGSYPWTYQITDDAIVDGCFVELWPLPSSRNAARKADIFEDVAYANGALVISATKKPTANIHVRYTISL